MKLILSFLFLFLLAACGGRSSLKSPTEVPLKVKTLVLYTTIKDKFWENHLHQSFATELKKHKIELLDDDKLWTTKPKNPFTALSSPEVKKAQAMLAVHLDFEAYLHKTNLKSADLKGSYHFAFYDLSKQAAQWSSDMKSDPTTWENRENFKLSQEHIVQEIVREMKTYGFIR